MVNSSRWARRRVTHASGSLLRLTIALVESIGLASASEGVEKPSPAAILETLGRHSAQGDFFSGPVTGDVHLDALSADQQRGWAAR